MTTLFCVRPATRNIGNDLINKATANLLFGVFGSDTGIVNIPALKGAEFGGFTTKQVYDMNRFADGIVVGGGNLFENGQLSIDPRALRALRVPMLLIGLSHGRIYGRHGSLVDRTDAMPTDLIKLLLSKSTVKLVRDEASRAMLGEDVAIAGCPSMFMAENPSGAPRNDTILLSVRHPGRMNVPAKVQWRVAEDVRAMLSALRLLGGEVMLACHDYADIEFASGFPETRMIYFDDVERYVDALRRCRLCVSYRLHSFLPCLAFGTHAIHLSYDERGSAMVRTAGMAGWDIDILSERDIVAAMMERARDVAAFHRARSDALSAMSALRERTISGIRAFAAAVDAYAAEGE